ncbi:MAG: yrbD [Sedimentibacter sp.]|jgi:AGCS family alanine or glycine:cation symporter|nr:yrbD [Sedimentibacter sp.]
MVQQIMDSINGYLWSNVLIAFALLSGLYYTIRTKGAQFRYIKLMTKYMFEKNDSNVGRSAFQSFALTMSTRVGTGNIAGVASAISIGGPGAVFWMWVSAIFGAGTTIIECTLSQVYKSKDGDEYRGGPQYFIDRGLGIKWYAMLFAICSVFALGFCTPGMQANAIADAMNVAFGINKMMMGVIIAVLSSLIIFGGIKRISKFAELIAPIMAIVYICVAVIMIVLNFKQIPEVLSLIFSSAFGAQAIFGGIVGNAIMMGVKRGIYSNEAGMGTASQGAATAEVSHPAKSGLVQAMSVYIDTIFVCTATAMMILFTGMYNVDGIIENLPGIQAGPGYVQGAIDTFIPGFGSSFVAVAMLFFAFTTILGNYYAAETGAAYICKKSKNINQKYLLGVLRIATISAILIFCSKPSLLAWALADLGMGVMSWLNLTALILLSNVALKVFKDFEEQYKLNGKTSFDPEKLGIKNTEVWKKSSTISDK